MVRDAAIWSCCLVLLLSLSSALGASEDAPLDEAWGRAGQGVQAAARETGHAFRDVAKATGSTAKRGAREVGHASRDAVGEVGDKSDGIWDRASRSLAEALDDLAAALREFRNGEG